jgi:outer membrane protein OmpA-like peptidoglycan-associated protein/tetratricopeptide (TPR) repeat protein
MLSNWCKYTIISLLTIFSYHFLSAQPRKLKKANELYKSQKYGAAIPFFEAIIKTDTTQNSIKSDKKNTKTGESTLAKLANCYRMTNKMPLAAPIYTQLATSSSAKPIYFFYLGEALMSSSKYDAAKKAFEQYATLAPQDSLGAKMAAACDKVRDIRSLLPEITITPFAYNSETDESSPVFWKDQIVFSSDRKRAFNLLKEQSGWTGRDYVNLYAAKRINDTLYETPTSYNRLNALNKNTANATFAQDSMEVYFTQNSYTLNKSNGYNLQIFKAINDTKKEDWHKSEPLPFCLLDNNYMHPAISPDGKELFFTSDKPSGAGGTDIYVATRTAKGWGVARSLGNVVNTPSNEGFPFMHPDGRHLFFCSKGHVGFGGFDIFVTQRDAYGNWANPINIGKPINSPSDDISICIAKDNKHGMFTSSRDGGDDDIFLFNVKTSVVAVQQTAAADTIAKNTFIIEKLDTLLVEKRLLAGELLLLDKFLIDKKVWTISTTLDDKLEKLATVLHKYPTLSVEIVAHVSCKTSEKERSETSLKRANVTRLALLRKGDFRKRVTAKASDARCNDGEGQWKDALLVKIIRL